LRGGSWEQGGAAKAKFVGTTAQTVTMGTAHFWELEIAKTGTGGNDDLIFTDNADIDQELRLTNGDLDLNTNSVNMTVAGDWTVSSGATFDVGTSLVTLDGSTTDQTITSNGVAFYDLTLNNTAGAGSDDIILADALDVNNDLTITDGDLDPNTNSVNIFIGGDMTIGASGSFTKATEDSNEITFDGSGTQTLTDSATVNLGDIIINGSSNTLTSGSNLQVTSLLVSSGATFDDGNDIITISNTSTSTPFNIIGTSNINSTVSSIIFDGTVNPTSIPIVIGYLKQMGLVSIN